MSMPVLILEGKAKTLLCVSLMVIKSEYLKHIDLNIFTQILHYNTRLF